jgi:hypothetical protein
MDIHVIEVNYLGARDLSLGHGAVLYRATPPEINNFGLLYASNLVALLVRCSAD